MDGDTPTQLPLILSVVKASELGEVRRRVLLTRYQVVCTGVRGEVEGLCREHPFDLVLLCHSLSVEECQEVIRSARMIRPEVKILRIVSLFSDKSPEHVNGVVGALSGPLALFASIDRLLRSGTNSSAQFGRNAL